MFGTPITPSTVTSVAAPRFIFVTGKRVAGAVLPRWPGGSGPFIGDTTPDGAWIAWRLAGANNRELGRSARVFPDIGACRTSITDLRAGLDRAQPLVAMGYTSGLWEWQLELDGENVAVSGRGYHRERECRYNLRQFLAAAAAAKPSTERSTV